MSMGKNRGRDRDRDRGRDRGRDRDRVRVKIVLIPQITVPKTGLSVQKSPENRTVLIMLFMSLGSVSYLLGNMNPFPTDIGTPLAC